MHECGDGVREKVNNWVEGFVCGIEPKEGFNAWEGRGGREWSELGEPVAHWERVHTVCMTSLIHCRGLKAAFLLSTHVVNYSKTD